MFHRNSSNIVFKSYQKAGFNMSTKKKNSAKIMTCDFKEADNLSDFVQVLIGGLLDIHVDHLPV